MNGQKFYDNFKDALDYLGVGFRGMAEVKVSLDKRGLLLEANGRSCLIIFEEA